MNRREEIEAERRREAEAVLDRAARESEVFGDSSAGRAGGRTTGGRLVDHFTAADAPRDDAVEVWGRRIARIAALVVALGLLVHLVRTYLVG